jgi:hypothetical protein
MGFEGFGPAAWATPEVPLFKILKKQ